MVDVSGGLFMLTCEQKDALGFLFIFLFIYQRRCFSAARLCACVCTVWECLIFLAHHPPYLRKELKAVHLLFLMVALINIRVFF